jgi:hypothetical protein
MLDLNMMEGIVTHKKSFTDSAYKSIERLEGRKKRVVGVEIACFVIAPMGLIFDLFILDHQKGGLANLASDPLILIIALAAMVILVLGFKLYTKIRKWEKQLGQLEQLEKTIYQEVLRPKGLLS